MNLYKTMTTCSKILVTAVKVMFIGVILPWKLGEKLYEMDECNDSSSATICLMGALIISISGALLWGGIGIYSLMVISIVATYIFLVAMASLMYRSGDDYGGY